MKRVGLAVLLTLVFCGTAEAKPWLTTHRAKQAIARQAQRDLGLTDILVVDCVRRGRIVVQCAADGYLPDGPSMILTDSTWSDAAGQELYSPYLARLGHRLSATAD